jgi:hypothetical protein
MCRAALIAAILIMTEVSMGQTLVTDSTVSKLLDRTNLVESVRVFVELRAKLQSGDAEAVQALRTSLGRELVASTDPAAVRTLGRVMAAAPSEDALVAALDKLGSPDPAMRAAACDVVSSLGCRHVFAPELTKSGLARLEGLLKDEGQPVRLQDEALMAAASLKPGGFEVLMRVGNTGAARSRFNAFYSALSLTGDARALKVLRDAVTSGEVHDGLKIQALQAMGDLNLSLRREGRAVDLLERLACIRVVWRLVGQAKDDQVFGAGLRALMSLESVRDDGMLYKLVQQSLRSQSAIRKQAALDGLYQSGIEALDPVLLADVQAIALAEDAGCRGTAEAILAECELKQNIDSRP